MIKIDHQDRLQWLALAMIDEWILCGMWSSDWRCNVEHHRFRKEIQLGRNSNRSKPRSFQEAFVTQSQIVDTSHLPQPGTISYTSDTLSGYFPGIDPESVTIQCFPLYSVLLAVGRTAIDFFSLDVEGHELKILETIPGGGGSLVPFYGSQWLHQDGCI